jgi:hypothetical protein
VSCTPGTKNCDTFSQAGVVIHAQAGSISAIRLTGDSCSDAELRCVPMGFSTKFTPGCDEYQVLPRRGGTCTIHIDFSSGYPFDASVEMFDGGPGCGGGVQATNYADGDITVPSVSSGDASTG